MSGNTDPAPPPKRRPTIDELFEAHGRPRQVRGAVRWSTPGADEAERLRKVGRHAFDPENNRGKPRPVKPELPGQLALGDDPA